MILDLSPTFLLHEYGRADGRGWIDNQQDCPEGEPRGQATLVKITEDVRKYAAENAIDTNNAIEQGLREKAAEFQHSGAEIYSKS